MEPMETGVAAIGRGFFSYSEPTASDPDGSFTLVARKKRKNRTGKAPMKVFTPEQKLEKSRAELRSDSKWLENVARIVREAVATVPAELQEILCLGLGSPSESTQTCFQLSFLLELRDNILPNPVKVVAFDPVFSPEDKALLTSLGIQIFPDNREGKHEIEGSTLAYMPHCDRNLYESFLRANWTPEALAGVLLIGNDLRGYVDSIPSRVLGKESPCIFHLGSLLASTPLPEHRAFPDAFSSTAVQHIIINNSANSDSGNTAF